MTDQKIVSDEQILGEKETEVNALNKALDYYKNLLMANKAMANILEFNIKDIETQIDQFTSKIN